MKFKWYICCPTFSYCMPGTVLDTLQTSIYFSVRLPSGVQLLVYLTEVGSRPWTGQVTSQGHGHLCVGELDAGDVRLTTVLPSLPQNTRAAGSFPTNALLGQPVLEAKEILPFSSSPTFYLI